MCQPNRLTLQTRCQTNSTAQPATKDTAPSAPVRIAKVNLQLSDSYLAVEEAPLAGLAGLKYPRDINPKDDSVRYYTVHAISVVAGGTLLVTNWKNTGWRALGGGLTASGVTGLTLELLEDNKVTVKLPTYYKVGCSVLFGLLGSAAFATADGFNPAGLGGDNNSEFGVDEHGR